MGALSKDVAETISFGPKMRALNPRQQAFVVALWERQPISNSQAAKEAGYSNNQGSAEVQSTRLMANPAIREAIIEYGHSKMTGDAPKIYEQLLQVAADTQHKDFAKVALALFGRAGFHEAIEKNVNVTVSLSDAEKIAKIRLLAEKHHIPVEQVLGNVVDVEYEDVSARTPELEAYLNGPEDEY